MFFVRSNKLSPFVWSEPAVEGRYLFPTCYISLRFSSTLTNLVTVKKVIPCVWSEQNLRKFSLKKKQVIPCVWSELLGNFAQKFASQSYLLVCGVNTTIQAHSRLNGAIGAK